MGVVNVTPDSFSDGGRYLDHETAVAHGRAAAWRRGPTWSTWAASRPDRAPTRCPVAEELRPGPAGRRGPRPAGPGQHRHPQGRGRAWPPWPPGPPSSTTSSASLARGGGRAPASAGSPCTCRATPARCSATRATTTWSTRSASLLVERAETARRRRRRPRCGSTRASGSARPSSTTWRCSPSLDALVATGFPVVVGTSRKRFLGPCWRTADGRDGARRRRRPPRGLAGHRHLGATGPARDGAGPRRGRHRRRCGGRGRPVTRAVAPAARWGMIGDAVRRQERHFPMGMKGKWAQGISPATSPGSSRTASPCASGRVGTAPTTAGSAARRRSSGSASRASPT